MSPENSPTRRSDAGVSRFTYLISAVINAGIWYFVNVDPTWQTVRFLTPDMLQVLDLANAALLVGVAVNVLFILYDGRWFKAAGDILVAALVLVLAVRVWQVFPFDFSTYAYDWTTVARIVVAIVALGSGIGVIAGVVRFTAALFGGPATRR